MRRISTLVAWGLVVALLIALATAGRQWNLDALFYGALAHRWAGATVEEAHQRTYDEVRALATPEDVQTLTESSPYRKALSADPGQLEAQWPLYVNKPLFVALLSVGARLGLGPVRLAFLLTTVCWALLAAVLLSRTEGWGRAAVLTAFLSPPLLEAGQLASPDSASALCLFVGFLALIAERPQWLVWSIFALASLARPDAVILAGALLVWKHHWRGVFAAAALLVLSMAVSRALGGVSWSALFVHSFEERLTTLEAMAAATVSLGAYLKALANLVTYPQTLHPSIALLFLAASVADSRRPEQRGLHAAIWGAGIVRLLVLPMVVDRYFLAHYALVLWACLARAKQPLIPTLTELLKPLSLALRPSAVEPHPSPLALSPLPLSF